MLLTRNNMRFPSGRLAAALYCLLSCLNAAGAEEAFVIDDLVFRSNHDQTEQRYVLMTPKEWNHKSPISILVALHGHGTDRWQFVRQSRDECRVVRAVAAEHSMLLVAPDYRAKTSWMGPAAEADVLQLLQQLNRRFTVDRVIVAGGSMGGTAALTFAALHPKVVDGVVALNGTANLLEYDRFQDAIVASFGGTKQQIPEEYRKRSAEFHAEKFTMPLATTTGGRDNIVPSDSTIRLVRDVRQHNDSVLSIHRADGGHSTNANDTRRALEFVLTASAARADRDLKTIVAFGDSTTARRGKLNVYADILGRELKADGRTAKIINAGIGGNNTKQASLRFENDVVAAKPDTVVIQFGINDAAVDVWKTPSATKPRVSLDEFTNNICRMVATLKSMECQVILMTPNPLRWTENLKRKYGQPPYVPDDTDGFNVLLNDYAESVRTLANTESVTLVDVDRMFRKFDATPGHTMNELLLDGMHPNDRGHRMIATALMAAMKEHTSKPLIESITKPPAVPQCSDTFQLRFECPSDSCKTTVVKSGFHPGMAW